MASVAAMVAWGLLAVACLFLLVRYYQSIVATTTVSSNSNEKHDIMKRCLAFANHFAFAQLLLSVCTATFVSFGAFCGCGGPQWLWAIYYFVGLVGMLLGLVSWTCLVPAASRRYLGRAAAPRRRRRRLVVVGIVVPLLFVAQALVIWFLLHDSVQESEYVPASDSPYYLPFPENAETYVLQGNNARLSHQGNNPYAWDFRRPCGTTVVASRAGIVTRVQDSFNGIGESNFVEVFHNDDDGTLALYGRIEHDSVVVEVGTEVKRGDALARVGNVGESLTGGNLHFEVSSLFGESLPVSFRDVPRDAGVPRSFRYYKSGNKVTR